MSTATALSEKEIEEVRAELAAGRSVTVWFTEAAVGMPVGGSAKIVSIGDPAVGEFIQVRPTGSRDELFCSPAELTRTRPPRRRAGAKAEVPRPREASGTTEPARPARSRPRAVAAAAPATAKTATEDPATDKTGAGRPVAEKTVAEKTVARSADGASTTPAARTTPLISEKTPKPAKRRSSKETTVPDITVVLQPTSDGEWTASVVRGSRTVVKPTPVPPADIAKAARCLPPAIGDAVDSALAAARARQQERVAMLQAELEAARQALQELGG
ncbi:hypothetical protein SAMN05443637_12262 [Pseudonocardia thermophila]|uniref:Translation initiation factor n=1 Tax=Pseudonocardia thermophila TaxID=1848 RepID=A0A1M6Z3M1_PSETH|nr:DUF6319 family protein [Pseudonocardia thermophila]SHL24987.1 hypothetical protein SAMN05443637_12262 [Pseudonocardia thermophila]